MERIDEIQTVLLKSNRVSHKHALTIAKLLIAVADGLKIGFIWDIGPPVTIHQIKELVDELKSMQLFNSDVFTVGVAQEICILNKELFLSRRLPTVFIDVTKTLARPKILDASDFNVITMLEDIREQVKQAEGLAILTVVEGSYCIPTIIGLLAGFPVVYWYAPSEGDVHCLSGIDLQVYKVLQDTALISSFSCPKDLVERSEIVEAINKWKEMVKTFKGYQVETAISKNEFTVNL